jgi:protein O-GlcNAc transferase
MTPKPHDHGMQNIERGMTLHGQGRLGEAELVYRSVLARDPQQFDALHLLGLIRLQQGHPAEAHELISKAVKIRPQSPQALAVLTAVFLALGRPHEALAACERCLAINPHDLDSLYNRAVLLSRLGRFDEALAAYDAVLARDGGLVDALFDRGNVLAQLARFEEAIAAYDKVLARVPGHVGALNNRGSALASLGRHGEALACCDKLLAVSPNHVEGFANRGTALKQLGREEEALACYARALALDPGHWNSLLNRGNALLALDRAAEALASYGQALALRPAAAEALVGRGNAQFALNRVAEALDSYERALAQEPGQRDALLNRGNVLLRLGRLEEAIGAYTEGLARSPQDAGLLSNRAGALSRAGRFEAAIGDYQQVLRATPEDPAALSGLVNALQETCDWDHIEGLLRALRALVDSGQSIDPLLVIRTSDDPLEQLKCARNYVRASVPIMASPPLITRSPSGKIRVAYLSAGLGGHAMAHLTARLFELHDRSQFETVAVALNPDDRSAMRGRLLKAFDRFEDVTRMSDRDVAALLRGLEVDVAVDLMGHTQGNRIGILAQRAAPIQVSYMGLPGTTGADFLDYVIADRVVLPFDQQPFFTERIVHLPDTYWVVDSTMPAPPSSPARSELGLPEQGFVFCSFNQSYKITARFFDTWMRLLERVDGAVLWLLRANEPAVANLRARAKASGVDPDRLVFAPRRNITEHLARLRAADLFLDTLPVNAHTTASDALWMGVPVVTCLGKTLAGRVAASLLQAAGLPELVTASPEDYEALAFALAIDRERLQAVRRKLDTNRMTCPLFDTKRFTRHVESAYRTMWEMRYRGEGPRSFSVGRLDA